MGRSRKRHPGGEFRAHVRKGDEVVVLSGRSLGEKGRILRVEPQRERAIVEGLNLVTKHQRAQGMPGSPAAARQQTGRIQKASPIHVSNLMLVCPNCNKATRVAHKIVGEHSQRACRHCGELVDRAQQAD